MILLHHLKVMNGQERNRSVLLLDTCSLLWLVSQQTSLSLAAKNAIMKNSDSLFISAISVFEIGIKYKKGLLIFPMSIESWLQQVMELHGITVLSIDHEIALQATQLPELHRDPADRIIIATAINQQLSIITPDQHIRAYTQVNTIW
jgi:PIN domain nuclease of toxin-antitoxin system